MQTPNPYHPLSPPDDPTLFFGRQEAIAFLRGHLVGANNLTMLVILGRLGIGKTALLHQIAYIVDERYVPVYVDTAQVTAVSEANLLRYLAQSVVAQMEAIGADTYRIPTFPDETIDSSIWRTWFAEDFLNVATTAIRRDRFLMLILDDFQLLLTGIDQGHLSADFIDYLGKLLAQYDRLEMVIGVDIWDEPRLMAYPPTADINRHFRLSPLDMEAAQQLFTEPIREQYQYTPEALERLLALCGGYPFFIHSICRLIYRHCEANRQITHISPAFIEVVYPAVMEEAGEIMENMWENTTLNMQIVLQTMLALRAKNPSEAITVEDLAVAIRQSGTDWNTTHLLSTLRKLDYIYLLQSNEAGEYRFGTEIEADWLSEKQSELAQQKPPTRLKPTPLAGLAAIIGVVVLIGMVLISGLLNGKDETAPAENAPPTATYGLDIEATRQAEWLTQTAQAIPSATITPSLTPTQTATDKPSSTPTDEPTATRTPRPSFTATTEPSLTRTPTDEPSATPRTPTDEPTATNTARINSTRTPRP